MDFRSCLTGSILVNAAHDEKFPNNIDISQVIPNKIPYSQAVECLD